MLTSTSMLFPNLCQDTPRDTLTSSDVSHVETESLHVKDQETQADLERLSNLEGSEYSDQAGIALKEMQTGFEFTVQIAEYKDNKKQQQHEKMVSGSENSARGKIVVYNGRCHPARELSP